MVFTAHPAKLKDVLVGTHDMTHYGDIRGQVATPIWQHVTFFSAILSSPTMPSREARNPMANALIIPIPAQSGSELAVFALESGKHIARNIRIALRLDELEGFSSPRYPCLAGAAPIPPWSEDFAVGSVARATDVPNFIRTLPARLQVAFDAAPLSSIDRIYDTPCAIVCAEQSDPLFFAIAVRYSPLDPGKLHVPLTDTQEGSVRGTPVEEPATVFFGMDPRLMVGSTRVQYTHGRLDQRVLLPNRVYGRREPTSDWRSERTS